MRKFIAKLFGFDDLDRQIAMLDELIQLRETRHDEELARFKEAEAAKVQLIHDGHAYQLGEIDARIQLLQNTLAKTEAQRDYFRQRADRLELILIQPKTPQRVRERPRVMDIGGVGRKPWSQVVADHVAKNKKLDEEEAQRKAAESAAEGTA
jgi:uncharacterized small protein (DUF1192 family)